MKTLICIASFVALSLTAVAREVSEEALKNFNKDYPGAEAVSWKEVNSSYTVFFTRQEISYRVTYDPRGNITESIRYYNGNNLPPILQSKVKKAYPAYAIAGVTELATETGINYYIVLEGEKKLINLKSDPSWYLTVESKYNKG